MEPDRMVPERIVDGVASLIELSRIDTLYGDLYLGHARELLQEKLSVGAYRGLQRMETELGNLPNKIHNAVMLEKWSTVKELTAQMQSLKNAAELNRPLFDLGKSLYETKEISIDPFSPGMQGFVGLTAKELPALRDKGLALLGKLMAIDSGWQEFYGARRDEVKHRAMAKELPTGGAGASPSPAGLRQEALEALEKGNFDKLQQLAGTLSETGAERSGETFASGGPTVAVASVKDFDYPFSATVLARAKALGLTLVRAVSRFQEFAHFAAYIWRPIFVGAQGEEERGLRLSALPIPAETPKALRDRIEMFVLHPFVNSAGVRFLPSLVAEDLLVEDFPEPAADADMPGSGLLEALGLTCRNCLSRLQIEETLLERGPAVVGGELGLDPRVFRLVCIPPDLHLRLGMERGWGNQTIWTHFDGYMLTADNTMHALAGGDVRFGGIYDMVGISRNYEADRVIARFAVVQRRRMAGLQELPS